MSFRSHATGDARYISLIRLVLSSRSRSIASELVRLLAAFMALSARLHHMNLCPQANKHLLLK